ncbi:MAG TPA: hypothetical protein VFR81_10325 [Longimicrobium sp.]|nr:hypothetical protein [Longimicrobium sp.]
MSHSISGFVARADVLRAGTAHLRSAYVASLGQGFGFVPVTEEVDEETGGRTVAYEQFYRLTDALARLGAAMSRGGGAVAYVETDYFGGTGEQAAIVWKDGRIYSGPEKSRIGAVSDALRRLGAEKGDAHDEFDAIGLSRHRHNDGWIEQAMAEAPPGDRDRRASIARDRNPTGVDAAAIGINPSDDSSTPFRRAVDHRIAGFIAPMEVLRSGTEGMRSAWIARLVGALGFLPITDELSEEAGGGGRVFDELARLTEGLARLGERMSMMDGVIYVETDYHGGDGEQAAVVWHTRDVVQGPGRSCDAIEDVLFWVDVEQGDHYDGFEAAGLDRHRHNDGWVRQARAEASAGGAGEDS